MLASVGLSEPRWAVEERMVERFGTQQRGLHENPEVGDYLLLPREIIESQRTQRALEIPVVLAPPLLPAYVEIL